MGNPIHLMIQSDIDFSGFFSCISFELILKQKKYRVDYEYNGDDDKYIILNVHVFKYMDSSLIDLDVQPNYIRVTLKGKSLQLALTEEVKSSTCTAKRSQTTGHLLVQVEKVNQIVRPANYVPILTRSKEEEEEKNQSKKKLQSKSDNNNNKNNSNYLEVDESLGKNRLDLANIVAEKNSQLKASPLISSKFKVEERENSVDFVDDLDVPPLI